MQPPIIAQFWSPAHIESADDKTWHSARAPNSANSARTYRFSQNNSAGKGEICMNSPRWRIPNSDLPCSARSAWKSHPFDLSGGNMETEPYGNSSDILVFSSCLGVQAHQFRGPLRGVAPRRLLPTESSLYRRGWWCRRIRTPTVSLDFIARRITRRQGAAVGKFCVTLPSRLIDASGHKLRSHRQY